MNARMYAVTPAVEAAWRALLEHVARDAQVELDYVAYPAPQPLEELWARADLGAVFMCGFPLALHLARVVPLAAPVARVKVLALSVSNCNARSRSDPIESTSRLTAARAVRMDV